MHGSHHKTAFYHILTQWDVRWIEVGGQAFAQWRGSTTNSFPLVQHYSNRCLFCQPAAKAGSNQWQPQTQHSESQDMNNHSSYVKHFWSELNYESHHQLVQKISWGTPLVLSLTLISRVVRLCRYHETMMQQSAKLNSFSCSFLSTSNNSAKTIISTPKPFWNTTLVNQQLNKPWHRSSSFCSWCVHLFNRLPIPDHTATPMTCTKHQAYPVLLNLLSP